MIDRLFHNVRFYILLGSVVLSIVIYLYVVVTVQGSILQIIRIQEIYSFASLILLYITMLQGPLCYTFKNNLPKQFCFGYSFARRAFGVAAFYFAFLHFYLTFFYQLEGFSGLGFLDSKYIIALGIGFLGLVIMFLQAITSIDRVIDWMSFPKWKLLHRFVYLAGLLILIHVVMLGTHYSDLSGWISQMTFFAVAFLLLLEAPRFDKLFTKFTAVPKISISSTIVAILLAVVYFTIISPLVPSSNGTVSFDVHASHKALAQQALQSNQYGFNPSIDVSKLPGLNGDKNKRYTVSWNNPQDAQPNQDTTLHFKIYDATSGNPVSFFRFIYAKTMHMIVVDNSLTYFSHIHPTQDEDGFSITTQFPNSGIYHIYLEFQPYGGIEQQVGFTLPVGVNATDTVQLPSQQPDKNLTKVVGDYKISLDTNGELNARDMSLGNDKLTFTIYNAKTNQPVTTLKPYLASFGHLTMINESNYNFIHVHPFSLIVPPPNANGGPTVDFLPIGIYGPFSPGIYRIFAEFNPDNTLITVDFTVKVN